MAFSSLASTFGKRVFGITTVAAVASTTMSSAAASSFYSLSAVRSDGTNQSMEEFRGKVVYATNVASK